MVKGDERGLIAQAGELLSALLSGGLLRVWGHPSGSQPRTMIKWCDRWVTYFSWAWSPRPFLMLSDMLAVVVVV